MRKHRWRAAMAVAVSFHSVAVMSGAMGASRSETPGMESAIESRDVRKVRQLVEAGADLEEKLFNRATPVIVAASAHTWDIVLYLLHQGADPAAENRQGVTLARLASLANLRPGTREYRDLEAVRDILRERGLY